MMAMGLIGGVIQGIGTFMQMSAQAKAAEYNASVAERNSRAVKNQTQNDIADKRAMDRRMLASMRTGFAQNGFEMAGTPMDIITDTVMEQEYDVAKLKFEGAMKAEGYNEKATLFEMEADSARTAGMIGLASGILSGFGNSYGNTGPGQSLFA